ncbi:MAG: hypothetical protein Q9183_001645 [Haloplaca sp. 2 TL-2023]
MVSDSEGDSARRQSNEYVSATQGTFANQQDTPSDSRDIRFISSGDIVADTASVEPEASAASIAVEHVEDDGRVAKTEGRGLGTDSQRATSSPSLKIDIDRAIRVGGDGNVGNLSPESSLDRSQARRSASPKMQNPGPSPRSRERAFSLRRSMLTRNIHGEPESSNPRAQQQPAVGPVQEDLVSDTPEKSRTAITIAPTVLNPHHSEPILRPQKPSTDLSTLPHYETWLRSRVARSSLLSSLRSGYKRAHKAILRIQELPPTKDGRHIDVDAHRASELIDERTNREYIDNTIRSCKYTVWNFLPRQLCAQFSKLANFYFLCVSILQMIPGLSTTGTYTTIIPLSFFVALSMAKEGYDDYRRFKLDKLENKKSTTVLRAEGALGETHEKATAVPLASLSTQRWQDTPWKDVRVGDIVRLTRDDEVPADLILLHARGMNGVAYVETMALDGETNLKSKTAVPPIAQACSTLDGIAGCDAHVVVEDPNMDLYKFEGRVSVGNENLPLTNNEIIYRGSTIRNTPEVFAMVIYTGEECKIRMNATKNPRIKAPSLQALVNKIVIITVLFVLVLAIFNTVAYEIWQTSTEEKSWYITEASVAFFPILTSFIIMFNTMIPLSLYVSLEIVKLCQMILMNDIEMYDEESNTPMEARTSTINEELGQIK